jgi:glutamyl-tRNA synthetase
MEDLGTILLKYALLNAMKHDGKAILNPVINNVIAERPELRDKVKELYKLAGQVISEVNSRTPQQQRKELESRWPELLAEKREESKEKRLPPLPNVERFSQVRTRFAPNPDGPLHLGNARPIILCKEYARMYNGRFVLRYEDTSPEIKAPMIKAYDWIMDDLRWLDAKPDEVYIQSDRLEIYYKYAEELLSQGSAYVCTCEPEKFKALYLAKMPCPCRDLPPELQLERWKQMLNGTYGKGEAVMRIKTDIAHPNPAIRDWPALRIRTTAHPRVGRKYRVWPLYNFSCAIDDYEMRISHIIRGKEHESNTIRQRYLYRYFGWEYPEIINVGRLGLESGILSKSKIRAGIEKGIYTGWDDPRLGTLMALRRRGIQPEAVRTLMIEVGPKPINATLSLGNIASANRAVVEPKARRYFFVANPLMLDVGAVPHEFNAKLPLHPDHPDWGTRNYRIIPREGNSEFLVSKDDQKLFEEGRILRLMGLFNVKILEVQKELVKAEYLSESYSEARSKGAPLIHWLINDSGVSTKAIMPDAAVVEGLSEELCRGLKPDAVIQFERFGFVRVDSVSEKGITVYFAHK